MSSMIHHHLCHQPSVITRYHWQLRTNLSDPLELTCLETARENKHHVVNANCKHSRVVSQYPRLIHWLYQVCLISNQLVGWWANETIMPTGCLKRYGYPYLVDVPDRAITCFELYAKCTITGWFMFPSDEPKCGKSVTLNHYRVPLPILDHWSRVIINN